MSSGPFSLLWNVSEGRSQQESHLMTWSSEELPFQVTSSNGDGTDRVCCPPVSGKIFPEPASAQEETGDTVSVLWWRLRILPLVHKEDDEILYCRRRLVTKSNALSKSICWMSLDIFSQLSSILFLAASIIKLLELCIVFFFRCVVKLFVEDATFDSSLQFSRAWFAAIMAYYKVPPNSSLLSWREVNATLLESWHCCCMVVVLWLQLRAHEHNIGPDTSIGASLIIIIIIIIVEKLTESI